MIAIQRSTGIRNEIVQNENNKEAVFKKFLHFLSKFLFY